MTPELIILAIVIITALVFDFTNGFHDTGNAMATSIATGALKPKVAVALSAVLNLVGAFLSVEVAKTVGKEVVNLKMAEGDGLILIVFTGLVGGIVWNLLTWLLGLPSSSSHALFGGLIGATIAGLGVSGVLWSGIVAKVIIPALAAPVIACLISTVGTSLIYGFTRRVGEQQKERGFRWGQVGTASLVSLAHGTNDAQKTMGVIFLALVASSAIDPSADIPFWVKLSCAGAIALGTYLGGWRIIRTLGKGLVEIDSPQGMAAEGASAAIILTSSHFGMALSTTHVATGSILGTGLGRKGADVRWGVAGRMAVAWVITLPAAAAVGAVCWLIAHGVSLVSNQLVGTGVVFLIMAALAGYMWRHSRKNPVDSGNVNADWETEAALSVENGPDRPMVSAAAGEILDQDHLTPVGATASRRQQKHGA
ncbi:inorganic phosphate transporter [Rothia kristinae]|uniref:Phosphate transporter n=1 Tax=Rothia kristinae TaxID=37923 RepID=A0A7T3F9M5_9MICC|nr:inorganic phosphate transporter [Rothia kristinae]TDP53597.1 PiT family inorganic phosphate transporter [Kocuria sp. AG109]MBG7587031.1 inorganic phosphate transporter [Rothia kristinae]MCA1170483.1 inorganic phosphate transporter [Rothia kristinae]MCT1357193.1 inorganic phosphate transporter [Rothia kristinae]MCT1392750.1 inorganic phosphate transporter [Rothia kristinae]